MNETTLNIEQEAFLAYMASANERLASSNKITLAFTVYETATEDTAAAYAEYTRLSVVQNEQYAKYRAVSAACNELTDRSMVLHDEWVKVRGY